MKTLIFILLFITTNLVAQSSKTVYNYDGGYGIRYTDSIHYRVDTVFNGCGKFILEENPTVANFVTNIRHFSDGKQTRIYVVDKKEIEEKTKTEFYSVFDIVTDNKYIIRFDIENGLIHVAFFENSQNLETEIMIVYIYILKQP